MQFHAHRKLHDDSPRSEYKPSKEVTLDDVVVKGLHYGQRKLMLSEIEFFVALIRSRNAVENAKPILSVYAGAANGSHLPFLFDLFPDIKHILVDPAPFCKAVQSVAEQEGGPIVELIQACCTDELCLRISRMYGDQYDMVLISDVRSGVPRKTTNNAEHTEIIERDNKMQRGWCWSLRALCAMLKFHPPYPPVTDKSSKYYDPADMTPESIEYLSGVMLLGVWAPKSSSEVRLVVEGPFTDTYAAPTQSYCCRKHEEQCYHYNTNGRYEADRKAEDTILREYVELFPTRFTGAPDLSAKLSKFLGFPLFLPLSEGFSEAHARWITLLYSTGNTRDLDLFEPLKAMMSPKAVADLVSTYASHTEVPEGVQVGGVTLTEDAWRALCRGKLTDAYSFPWIRWGFASKFHRGKQANKRRRGAD